MKHAGPLKRIRRAISRPIIRATGWLLPWPYRMYVGTVLRTSNVVWIGWEEVETEVRQSGGAVLAFYHEGTLISPYAVRHLNVVTMTTRKDGGRLIMGVLQHFGFHVVRTFKSDPRRTLNDVIDALRERPGTVLGLAVDGPSGPRRIAKPGAAMVCRALELPLFAVHFGLSRSVGYPSWDRCQLPLPFGRVVLRVDRVHGADHGKVKTRTAALQRQLDLTASMAEADAQGHGVAEHV